MKKDRRFLIRRHELDGSVHPVAISDAPNRKSAIVKAVNGDAVYAIERDGISCDDDQRLEAILISKADDMEVLEVEHLSRTA